MATRTPAGQTRNRIFEFVRQRLLNGNPPTVRDVQDAFSFRSVQTAREHLDLLVTEGRLLKIPGVSRGYRLPDNTGTAARPLVLVPLLGHVHAGSLHEAIETPEGHIGVQSREPEGTLFALRIEGESMRDAGIMPDDIVVVRRQPTAKTGDIVVALIDNEATVKTLRVIGRRLELHPENPAFQPIIPKAGSDVSILGKVIEVRRYLEMR